MEYLPVWKKISHKFENYPSLFKWLFGWPLSLIALYFIARLFLTQAGKIDFTLLNINLWLLLSGILSLLIYFFLRVTLWQSIIKQLGAKQSYKFTAYYWALAELKRYIPGNVWSIAGRLTHFSNQNQNKKIILKAYIHEAQLVVIGSATISLLSTIFIFKSLFDLHISQPVCVIIGTILFACCFSLLFSNKWIKSTKYSGLIVQGSFTYRLKLYSFASGAFFFFGLGQFLVISSILKININEIYVLSGLLCFSYLVGYLSIITPSGLGVREAVITYSFSKFMSAGSAALAALVSRVILILSEIIFLGIAAGWYFAKNKIVNFLEKVISEHPQITLLTGLVILYITYFTVTTFLRYDNYYTGRFDLGNMAQTVWNTMHGHVFELTNPNGTIDQSRLATHADFLLILLVPFYYIWTDPRMLLLIQTVILALGAYAVYLIGKNIFKNANISLIFSFMFLLNPSVERSNLYDFHAVTLATTFLLFAFYFIQKRRMYSFLFIGILAGLTKEQVWFMIGLMAFYLGFKKKRYIWGTTVFIIMAFISYYLISIAIPKALGAQHFALEYYADFGDTPASIVKHMILSPWKIITTIISPDRLVYYIKIFAPFGFLTLLEPFYFIFALPEIAIYILSNNNNFIQIYYQYTATITPFIIISSMYGLKKLIDWLPNKNITVINFCLVILALYTAYLFGPLPGSIEPNTDMYTKQLSDGAIINNFIEHIPRKFSVAASNNIGSHLSQRRKIYTIPVGVDKADVVAFLLTDPGAQPSPEYQRALVKKLEHDPNYFIKYARFPFYVFVKKSDRTYHWIFD